MSGQRPELELTLLFLLQTGIQSLGSTHWFRYSPLQNLWQVASTSSLDAFLFPEQGPRSSAGAQQVWGQGWL